MVDKSQEQAISLLEEAKKRGTLSPDVENRLNKLVRANVTDTLKTPEKRELTPKQVDILVITLKSRFESSKNKKLRKTIDFADVEKSLRASPEKLYALQRLEETGGGPQVIGIDGDEFVFEDRCKESPSGRRHLDADQSAARADEFGADMQSTEAYKAMQETGVYDSNSGSWLKTDPEHRKSTGRALRGVRNVGSVYVHEVAAEYNSPGGGWRASLKVKKV